MQPRLLFLAVLLAPGCAGFFPTQTNRLSEPDQALRAAQDLAGSKMGGITGGMGGLPGM